MESAGYLGQPSAKRFKPSVSNEFDYFQKEPIQAAIVNEYDREYSPTAAIQQNAPIEFEIKGGDRNYLDLNNSKLEIKCRLLEADDGNIAADANVGLANLTLHSLFTSVETELQGQTIGDTNNLYPYRAMFETLVTTNSLLSKTRLKAVGWDKDTAGHMADFRMAADGANEGFKERSNSYRESAQVTLIGRLHTDIFHQNLDIPSNVDMKLRLLPSRTPFYIKKPAANDHHYKVQIFHARFLARTKELSPNIILAHEKMLQKTNFRIPFTKVSMKRLTIPTGVTNIEFDNVYTGVLPKRVMLGMVQDADLNGQHTTNQFNFQSFNVRYLSMKVNGQDVTRIPYQPNFATGDYIREYYCFLEGLGLDVGTKSIDITPTDWSTSYNLYVFRLMPSGIQSIPVSGSARLELKFSIATAQNIIAILYSESNAILEIDRYRNVIIG